MTINHENFPKAIGEILNSLDDLKKIVAEMNKTTEPDKWFTLDELVEYDPEKRAKQTFYGLVSKGLVPNHKRGKKLLFLKSEIDAWLRSSSRVSMSDLEQKKGGSDA